jgi:deazaflavin-dependent oxidoreductase (nitroreductase family)
MALAELKSALERASEVQITVTGRRSGREISNPVWFVEEGDKLYLLPVKGSDADWYRNAVETPTIRLAADGAETRATATPVTDPAKVSDVVEKFRAKYGAEDVARYYQKLDAAVEVPLA